MIWLGTVLPWDSDTLSRSRPVMWITCNRTVSAGHSQIYMWDGAVFLLSKAKLHLAQPTLACIFCNITAVKVPSVSSRPATKEEYCTPSISQGTIIIMLCYCYFFKNFFFFLHLEEVHSWIQWPESWALSCERKRLHYQPLLMDDVRFSPGLHWVGLYDHLLSEVWLRPFLHLGLVLQRPKTPLRRRLSGNDVNRSFWAQIFISSCEHPVILWLITVPMSLKVREHGPAFLIPQPPPEAGLGRLAPFVGLVLVSSAEIGRWILDSNFQFFSQSIH